MSQVTTYSFSRINFSFFHPAVGVFPINGQGAGEISISNITDNTTHDVAADGSVMVSHIQGNNANISISVQQTSPFHAWLMNYYNFISGQAESDQLWASAVINISSPNGTGETIQARGVSPTKPADQPYQSQGQMVTWNFMAANCTRFPGAIDA